MDDRLKHYGEYRSRYEGTGTLTVTDGDEYACAFELGQQTDGQILLVCTLPQEAPFPTIDAAALSGHTAEGHTVRADREGFHEVSYLPELPQGKSLAVYATFRLPEVEVVMVESGEAAFVVYGITNFRLRPREFSRFAPLGDGRVMTLRLPVGDAIETIQVCPLPEYDRRVERIRALEWIDITAEIQCQVGPSQDLAALEIAIGDLCSLLSLGRGTKVEWAYRNVLDARGNVISRRLASRVTKPYSPYAPIDPRDLRGHTTKAYVERCFPVYRAKRDLLGLDVGVIDGFLDAKLHQDWLQVRGVKMVVAAEQLHAAYLRAGLLAGMGEFIDKRAFQRVRTQVGSALLAALINEGKGHELADRMARKLGELNRPSFRESFGAICADVGLNPGDDLDRFIACRNNLVHQGTFTRVPRTGRRVESSQVAHREYLFLMHFLDRLFLKPLDYSGPYLDWGTSGHIKEGILP